MKIRFVVIAKTDSGWLSEGIREYEARIKHYVGFEFLDIPPLKNSSKLPSHEIRIKESLLLAKAISPSDYMVLLDERGKELSSMEFSSFLNQRFTSGMKSLVFVAGGAFGVDQTLKQRADLILSLSRMTFSHQQVRLFFTEQLYRALTILNNESYHHE